METSRRAVVTFIRSYGDSEISDAIIRGVVSDEIKRIQTENTLLKLGQSKKLKRTLSEIEKLYSSRQPCAVVRVAEQFLGLIAVIYEKGRDKYESAIERKSRKKRYEIHSATRRRRAGQHIWVSADRAV